MELYKGKGLMSAIASYRDIMLADTAGKLFGKMLRGFAFFKSDGVAVCTQYGSGFNRGSCDIARVVFDAMSSMSFIH